MEKIFFNKVKKMSNIKNGSKKKNMAEIKKWRYLSKEKELDAGTCLDRKNVVKLGIGTILVFVINFILAIDFFTKSKNITKFH